MAMATPACDRPRRLAWLALSLSALACSEPEAPAPPDVPDIAYCDPVRDWEPEIAAREVEVLRLINDARAVGGRCGSLDFEPAEPLIMDPALRCAARIHALDMGEQDYFSNLDPDDLDYVARAELAEYAGVAVHQLIGAQHSTAEKTVDAILGNTVLCAKILDPEVTDAGIGHTADLEGASYPRYWTHVFGHD